MKLKLLAAAALTFFAALPAHAATRIVDFEEYALGPLGPTTIAFELDGLTGTSLFLFAGEIVEFGGSKAFRVEAMAHPGSGNSPFLDVWISQNRPQRTFLNSQLTHAEVTLSDGGHATIRERRYENLQPGETAIFDLPVNYGNTNTPGSFHIFAQAKSGYAYIDNLVFVDTIGTIPEPGTWAMLIAGFGAVGATVRRRKRLAAPAL